jgi:hypothetical protein
LRREKLPQLTSAFESVVNFQTRTFNLKFKVDKEAGMSPEKAKPNNSSV